MNETQFNERVTATLQHIEQAVEDSGADIEFENTGDMLTLEFTDGSKIIVNRQGAASQIWVASRSGGYHYNYQEGTGLWVNDQSGVGLSEDLSRIISQQARTPVHIA